MAFECTDFFFGGHIPHADGLVIAGSYNNLRIWTVGHRVNLIHMPFKNADFLPRSCMPQPNGLICAGCGNGLPIWAKGRSINRACVTFKETCRLLCI